MMKCDIALNFGLPEKTPFAPKIRRNTKRIIIAALGKEKSDLFAFSTLLK
ncbi:hypothetical protein VIBC2010_11221 [Vibrio caribbeanicus ATCC BAA-2122]|uniref:Uncharacterized protein n=1 Tax=Vibrio caribbeanicus ATCC BAA-2122 TaxID=796620 RepID=E3BN30_9VIBR|nr:hypothetical protein VIBC2010_11221 [Vibrio caribbeanicus ATCC BAA-2122]